MKKLYHLGFYTNGKIYIDEEIDNNRACQGLVHYGPDYKAYSVIATTRNIAAKKLKKIFEDEIKEHEKEIVKNRKILEKIKKLVD